MNNRVFPDEPEFVKSLRDRRDEAWAALQASLKNYCTIQAKLLLQEEISNGRPNPQQQFGKITIKSIILSHLKSHANGATLNMIMRQMPLYGVKNASRESVSSTLNRLKREGIIRKNPKISTNWVLSELVADG